MLPHNIAGAKMDLRRYLSSRGPISYCIILISCRFKADRISKAIAESGKKIFRSH